MLKLNAEFRTHYTAGDKWKKRRLKLYDFAGGGIANAGDIALLSQFWRYYRSPGDGLAHKGRLESGPLVVMIAYCTLGGLYALEGCYDLAKDYKGKQKGFSAKTVYKKALAAKTDLDKLFAVRDQKLQSLSPDKIALQTAQGRVLRDVRDLSLIEFSRVYVDSRKQKAARDLTTLGTIAVCATGAWPGAYAVLRGVKDVNLKKVGSGGIGFLISGSTLTAAPALIHGGAAITGKVCTSKLEDSLIKSQSTTIAALEKDLANYRDLAAQANPSVDHSQQFAMVAKLIKDRHEFLEKERRRQKREMLESFISYAVRGGPQIAFGAMLTRAGYKYNTNPVKAFKGVAQAATVNEVSWGSWLLDVTQKSARNEREFRRQDKIAPADVPFGISNSQLVKLEQAGTQ